MPHAAANVLHHNSNQTTCRIVHTSGKDAYLSHTGTVIALSMATAATQPAMRSGSFEEESHCLAFAGACGPSAASAAM